MSKKMSRREWSMLSLTGLAGFMLPSAVSCKSPSATGKASTAGVIIGAQTYSLRDRGLDQAIVAMNELGITSCELWQGHVQPLELQWKRNSTPEETRARNEGIRKWRDTITMEEIAAIKTKLNKAGINIQAYNGVISKNDSDKDLDLVFRTAQALGTNVITTSATVDVMKRVDEFAKKYKTIVAMHNHANVRNPNEFATPESFERGMEGNSEFIRINLDIGHFTAANYDAVDFMNKYHDKIVCVHLKDRKKNQGPGVPFGEGDAPLAEVLKLIRDKKWNIPANIEYEYNGENTMAEMKKCVDFCKKVLTS